MMKPTYILLFAAVIIIAAVLYYQDDADASDGSIKEIEKVEPVVYSRMDSIIFEYDSLLSNMIEKSGSVGAAVAVTHKDTVVFLKSFGVKKAGGKDSIDNNTVFRLASVSKPISGVLAGILSDENIINIEDRIIDYLPGFKLKDTVSTHLLSIRNVLSHTSGLVPHAYDNLVEAGVPMEVILDSLFRVNITDLPGRLYGYQNVIFSLFDTICTVATRKSYEELLYEKVFVPFGMNNASAGFPPFAKNRNKAFPHVRYRGGFRALPLNDRYYDTNAAAGINASISDMAGFLVALTANDSLKLKPDVVDEVLTPQIISPLRWNYLRKWGKVDSKHYALGWRIIGYKGRQIAYHGGYVQGYRAEIAFCPEEEIGITFLTNSPNGIGSSVVPEFLNLYFNWEYRDIEEFAEVSP